MDEAPLRTLHINTARGWRGGEQQSLYLVQGLRERGHVAEAVAQPDEEFVQRVKAIGATVHEIRMRGEWDLLAAWRLRRLLREGRYDVTHAHTGHAHMLLALAAWRLRPRPLVIVSRRVDFSLHKAPFGLSRLKYMMGVDRFIAIGEFIREVMIRDGLDDGRIRVVHSSQDPARFRNVEVGALRAELGLPPGAPVLGNVAALVGHKAQCDLLDAMPAVLEALPDLRLVIVGEGELRGALTAQAEALGIADRVVFAGYREDVLRFYHLFDVFVLSSKMEGLGGVSLEAMAMGCPVVATDAGGVPEIVRDGVNGILAPRRDPAALARGVIRMFRDADLRKRCVARGRRTVTEDFCADRMVEDTLAVYREALRERAMRR